MKDSRHFAADLMNSAGIEFEAADVALASNLVERLETVLADWLADELRGDVAAGDLIERIRSGSWRPDLTGRGKAE